MSPASGVPHSGPPTRQPSLQALPWWTSLRPRKIPVGAHVWYLLDIISIYTIYSTVFETVWQNRKSLKELLHFWKNFLGSFGINHFSYWVALESYFTLIYFKHSYSDISVKILNFLWRSGASPPKPSYTPSNEWLAWLGGPTLEFWEKIKVARGKFKRKSQQFAWIGRLPLEPLVGLNFQSFLYFWSNLPKNSWNFWKVIKFFKLYMLNFDKFNENFPWKFYLRGAPTPERPIIEVYIIFLIFPIVPPEN